MSLDVPRRQLEKSLRKVGTEIFGESGVYLFYYRGKIHGQRFFAGLAGFFMTAASQRTGFAR